METKIPGDLLAQTHVFLSSPGFEPAVGSPAVYAVVDAIDADLPFDEGPALEWVERQRGLQAEAGGLVAKLEEKWPSPSVNSVIAGEAVFPPYHGTEWFMILVGVPWARDLDVAVHRAKEALAD